MKLNRIGFVGWRGMVGGVLLRRMLEEKDFALIAEPVFFTTSQVGQAAPDIGRESPALIDAADLDALAGMDAIVTCQGGDYTAAIHDNLRARNWRGFWIDAASTLRMRDDATIILDPLNGDLIERELAAGKKDFIGGNCTVSLMLMALHGLFKEDLIEWLSVATYQAISGGGARQMRELVAQMGHVHASVRDSLDDSILEIDAGVARAMRDSDLPHDEIGRAMAGNLLPWIDQDLETGSSREEWKAAAEGNKILGRLDSPIPIESTCVRVGVMRCHSQAFTIKLKKNLAVAEIENLLANANEWVRLIQNTRDDSLRELTPAAVNGTLDIAVGRVKKLNFGDKFVSAFSVGDQLLWGAAESLRRMLRILHAHA